MSERIWLSNFDLDMIQGGTEIVGTQYCRAMKLKYISSRKAGISLENKDSLMVSRDLDEWLKGLTPELLVYNSTNCWSAKPKSDKSVCVCCENFLSEANSVKDSQFTKTKVIEWNYQKKSLYNADKIVVISEGEKRDFGIMGFKDTTVIEPYVDLNKFHPLNIERKKKTALFVGRRHIRKGYDILKELEERFPEIIFSEVVDGSITTEELNYLYNISDFLLMPSRYESFGFIFAEALATNTPIISSRVGLFKTWQPKEYGIFPEDITADSFSEAIESFESNKFEKSRELAESRFSYKRFKGDCDDLLSNW